MAGDPAGDKHHVILYQELVPGKKSNERFRIRPTCFCGWVGNAWLSKAFARHEADQHLRFPERGIED